MGRAKDVEIGKRVRIDTLGKVIDKREWTGEWFYTVELPDGTVTELRETEVERV